MILRRSDRDAVAVGNREGRGCGVELRVDQRGQRQLGRPGGELADCRLLERIDRHALKDAQPEVIRAI